MKKYLLAATAATLVTAPAHALTIIDFDAGVTGPSYSESGVDFTPIGGGAFVNLGNTPNGTRGLIAQDAELIPINAVIGGGTDFVSVDLGDFNADSDDIFLRAYDAANVFLGEDTLTLAAAFSGMETLSVSFANISRVEFGGVGINGHSSVFADNFTFNEMAAAVPEPATWAFMIFGFGAIGGAMRRQRKATVKVSYA